MLIDERPRFYQHDTPRGVRVIVGLGGADDPVSVEIIRPLEERLGTERLKLTGSREELWALWACISDGLAGEEHPPAWACSVGGPIDAAGQPLPPLPGTAAAAWPF